MLKKIPAHFKWLVVSFLVSGFFIITSIYYLHLWPVHSVKIAVATLMVGLLGVALFYGLIVFLFIPWYKSNNSVEKIVYPLIAVLAGFLSIIVTPIHIPKDTLFFSYHTLGITAAGEHNPASDGATVVLQGFFNGSNFLSYEALKKEGNWQRNENELRSLEAFPSSLQWEGQIDGEAFLLFQTQPDGGMVRIEWDGEEKTYDLYSPAPQQLRINFYDPPSIFATTILPIFITGLCLSVVFFLIFSFFSFFQKRMKGGKVSSTWQWFLYAIPMILVWCIWLCTFFPGAMSSDSINQWTQVLSGRFNDWHPVAHTLVIWLLSRIWLTPAVLPILQILLASLVIANGLGLANQLGTPSWVTWIISWLIALSPVNASLMITLWKDVLYSLALLSLTIEMAWIIFSAGTWLNRKLNLSFLAVTLLGISLFRHNGLPVAILVPAVIILFYKRWQLRIILTTVLTFSLFFFVRGPLYNLISVQRNSDILGYTVFLHHIAAHLSAGTPMTPDQENYLGSLLPEEDWNNYRCFSVNNLYYNDNFNNDAFAANKQKTVNIFLSTLQKNPVVNLRHMLCSSSMIWEIYQSTDYFYVTAMEERDGNISWIKYPDASSGLVQDSKIPLLIIPLYNLIKTTTGNHHLMAFIWRPALFLYVSMAIPIFLACRFRNWRFLLIAAPLVVHSGFLWLTIIAQDLRYQYGVYPVAMIMVALFCIKMDALPEKQPGKDSHFLPCNHR